MKNTFNYIRNLKLPYKKEIKSAISSFTKKEWAFFFIFSAILLVSTVLILGKINRHFTVGVPMYGGEIKEGIIGTPRFINPVLASTDADRDLVSLIYGGLMRKSPDGTMVPDLAQSVTVEENGLSYIFTLKDEIYFHDGEPVTSDDVIFTISAIKDPIIKSPRKGNWDGVRVDKIDDKTIKFTLQQPYASFLENTAVGIMPEHIWGNSPIELNEANTAPIGSGPYKVEKANKHSSGVIDTYELFSFSDFSLGKPYINKITLKFYPNEEAMLQALSAKEIGQISSLSPENALALGGDGYKIESSTLPRIFGLFFNQNENQLFTNKTIIRAINLAVDKEKIVREVLGGYGVIIEHPLPQGPDAPPLKRESQEARTEAAKEALQKDGWKIGLSGYLEKTVTDSNKKKVNTVLAFAISTGNAPELARSAEIIKSNLESLGMKVEIKTFEIGNLNQAVIRPREYDALLFGEIINTESDLYAFWHSSQRKDPGLNVAMYTNAKVDKLLEDAFIVIDPTERAKKYAQFEEEIRKDMPAVFLYSPDFIYLVDKDLLGLSLVDLASPAERFANSHLWYTRTDNVWKIFSKKESN